MRLIRTTLWLTVIYNFAAAFMLFFPASGLGQLVAIPTDVPAMYSVLASYFVFAFGCAYLWMALQDDVIRPLLYFSAFAKAGAFMIVWILWSRDEVSGRLAVLLIGDAVFAAIWFTWLFKNPTSNSVQTTT